MEQLGADFAYSLMGVGYVLWFFVTKLLPIGGVIWLMYLIYYYLSI